MQFVARFSISLIAVLYIAMASHVHAKTPEKVARYFGRYEIHDIRNLGESITSDREARKWLGSFVELHQHRFSIRNTEISKPRYGFENIRVESLEGNVISKELSIFWGVATDRTLIKRILIFESQSERYAYEKMEVIDEDHLLDIYDGRIYFLRRVSGTRTP